MPTDEADRRSSGGILIPATAQQQKRLVWGEVVGAGPNVRSAEEGDHVLFNPEDRYEVEVHGDDFLVTAPMDSLTWLQKQMEAKYQLTFNQLGPKEEGCGEEL